MAKKKKEFGSLTELMDFFKATGAAGGKKRAAKMTQAERSASARKAARARWKKAAAASAKIRSAKTKQRKG